MRSLPQIVNDNLFATRRAKPKKERNTTLHTEAIALLKAERDQLQREVVMLRRSFVTHEQKEARLARSARSAEEDADALLEALCELARAVSNTQRAGREARERARKVLEDRGIRPPSTLGSSRNRKSAGTRKSSAAEKPLTTNGDQP